MLNFSKGFTLNTRIHQFYSNFSLGHQLVHQTYIIHSYNYKDKIKNYKNTPKLILANPLYTLILVAFLVLLLPCVHQNANPVYCDAYAHRHVHLPVNPVCCDAPPCPRYPLICCTTSTSMSFWWSRSMAAVEIIFKILLGLMWSKP